MIESESELRKINLLFYALMQTRYNSKISKIIFLNR